MRNFLLILLALLLALPAVAADFDVKWLDDALYVYENESNKSISLWVEGDFTGSVTVNYEFRLPRGEPSTGTVLFKPDDRYQSMYVHAPNDAFWGGILYGDLTLSYTHPVSGQPVTKVAPFMMLEDEQLNIQPESTMLREGGGIQSIRFTVSPVSIVPISFYLVVDDESTTWQVDYDVLGGPLAIEPGQSSGEILVDVPADSQLEGIETFRMKSIDYWSEWVTIGIIDAEERPATITPEDVDVFTGDPFSLDVTLPFGVPWIAFAQASSSDPNVASPATPFSRIDAGSLSATIPMRAGDTGDATVTVSVDQGLGISPVSATVHVYGGEITFDTDGLRLGIGESARVDVQLNNPPPAGVSLMIDAANSRVAGAEPFLVIAADGTGTMTVTGLAAGATRLQIYSPGGRVVAWLDVEVVKTEVVVTSVTPPVGPPSGGTAVTINGRGFVAPCTVSFGGSSATGIAVLNETTIRATTSARAAGTVAATVTCSGQTGTLANAFTYAARRGRAVRH